MKGRTAWIVSWFVWLWIAISERLTMYETIVGGVVAGIVVILIAWLGKKMLEAMREISQQSMFDLCFVDHEPPGEREIDRGNFHLIPLGKSEHWIKVVTSIGINLTHFNMRFIPTTELSKRQTDPPTDMHSTIVVQQVFVTHGVAVQANRTTIAQDGLGGIDMTLERPVPWGGGKALFLKIDVYAHVVWSGKISFQGYDQNNNPRYARADVSVLSDGIEAQTFQIRVSAVTISDARN